MDCGVRTVIAVALCALALPAGARAEAPEPEDGWAQRALDIQYEIAGDVGWTDMPWVGTHNSFNSTDQVGFTLSANDSNQQIRNVEQLDAGVRSLELDVHKTIDGAIRVCHGRGADQLHFGCTTEKLLGPTLDEIGDWLADPEHADVILLLYLEDHMENVAGYNAAAATVTAELGPMLYAPPAGGCSEVPETLTRDDIRAAGKQVLIVSDCGPEGASGWHAVAHNWNSHVEDRPVDYEDFPSCGPDYTLEDYSTKFVRYYEDSTALTNQVGPPTGVATADDGITPPTAAAMARCGVDLIGLDQVTGPADPRFEGLVWSWQVNRPRPGRKGERDCAVQRRQVAIDPSLAFPGSPQPATRAAWFDQRCSRLHQAACRSEAGEWSIPPDRTTRRVARRACEAQGGALGTPRTGYEAQELDEALAESSTRQAWIGAKRRAGTWTAPDPPPAP